MPEMAVFERSRRELSLDVSVGVHILLVVEQSSLESQSRGCVPRLHTCGTYLQVPLQVRINCPYSLCSHLNVLTSFPPEHVDTAVSGWILQNM